MPEADQVLLTWLETLPADMLAKVIASRLDAEPLRPPPRHLRALAARLTEPQGVTATIRTLPTPAVEVLRVLAALPNPASRDAVAALLGVDPDDPDLVHVITLLTEHALAWVTAEGQFEQLGVVAAGWAYPLGLGQPVRGFLSMLDCERLKDLARRYQLPTNGSKQVLVDRMVGCLSDRDQITQAIKSGPAGVMAFLQPFVDGPPVGTAAGMRLYFGSAKGTETPARWAADHGLLWPRDWDLAEMPREVGLVLRGPKYHAPFTPRAPEISTVKLAQETVEKDAAIASGHLLDRMVALLDLVDKTPIATIKTGGVGQRELKRLAKVLHCGEDELRVLVETAFDADLIEIAEDGLRPAPVRRTWAGLGSAERYETLVKAWWSGERAPLPSQGGPRSAALIVANHAEVGVAVRKALLGLLSDLPSGTAVDRSGGAGLSGGAGRPRKPAPAGAAGPGDEWPGLSASVAWRCPVYPGELIDLYLPSALMEAELLGLVARGGAGALGRALAAGKSLASTAGELLTVTCQTALLGADLTAVVTGPPSAELSQILDRLAKRESRGTASVWRFGPATIRQAMDGGFTARQILDDLAAIAAAGVPQPLDYLVKDVARRHGEVSVTEVVCVVRGVNPALLAEMVGHRKLVKLGLSALAPTVLASGVPLEQTLSALREAGYSPIPAGVDGVSTIKPARSSRAGAGAGAAGVSGASGGSGASGAAKSASPAKSGAGRPEPKPLDPEELAKQLLAAPIPESMSERDVQARIARHATRLASYDRFNLQYLVCHGIPVRVQIKRDQGGTERCSLESGELEGAFLHAWCSTTQDYRRLRMSSLITVQR
jgi:hypothetical protein